MRLNAEVLMRMGTALLTCCAMGFALVVPASAHIPHPEEVPLYEGTDGPYVLEIVAVPFTGHLHVTVMFEPGRQEPLPYQPEVYVSAEPDGDGERVGPDEAILETFTPTHDYSTTLNPDTEGPWTVFVDITSDAGEEVSLALPITLRDPGDGIPMTAVLTGLGLAAPVAWLVWSGLRDRRRKRGSRAKTHAAAAGR